VSLNLNSNRGITQKEIESIMDNKNDRNRGSISSKTAQKNTDVDIKAFWATAHDPSPTYSTESAANDLMRFGQPNLFQ
jgi:hypothetical protein